MSRGSGGTKSPCIIIMTIIKSLPLLFRSYRTLQIKDLQNNLSDHEHNCDMETYQEGVHT